MINQDIVASVLITISAIINIWMAYRNYEESTKLRKEREKLNREKRNLALITLDQMDYKAAYENASRRLNGAYDYILELQEKKRNKDD